MPDINGRARGDELIEVFVETPRRLSARQEELLRELAEIEHERREPQTQELLREAPRLLHRRSRGQRPGPVLKTHVALGTIEERIGDDTDGRDTAPFAGQRQRRRDADGARRRAEPVASAARRVSRAAPAEPRRLRQLPEAVQVAGRRRSAVRGRPRWRATCSTASTTSSVPPRRSAPRPPRGSARGSSWSTSNCWPPWPSTASSRSPRSGSRSTPTCTRRSSSSPTSSTPRGPSWPSSARDTGSTTGCSGRRRWPSRSLPRSPESNRHAGKSGRPTIHADL